MLVREFELNSWSKPIWAWLKFIWLIRESTFNQNETVFYYWYFFDPVCILKDTNRTKRKLRGWKGAFKLRYLTLYTRLFTWPYRLCFHGWHLKTSKLLTSFLLRIHRNHISSTLRENYANKNAESGLKRFAKTLGTMTCQTFFTWQWFRLSKYCTV